jgi:hypothetical protein
MMWAFFPPGNLRWLRVFSWKRVQQNWAATAMLGTGVSACAFTPAKQHCFQVFLRVFVSPLRSPSLLIFRWLGVLNNCRPGIFVGVLCFLGILDVGHDKNTVVAVEERTYRSHTREIEH